MVPRRATHHVTASQKSGLPSHQVSCHIDKVNSLTMEPKPQPPKIPKDGPGPRGLPDCYYTSRVLNSTFRYVKFVKRLRAMEEEQRKGEENNLKELKDKQFSDFFIRCDRRSLINNVARRVDLCMESYLHDLQQKRKRLMELYSKEEEANIRKFVEDAQAAVESEWQEKVARLQHLLDKRRQEHEEKYKETPISKAAHVGPCILKLHSKEAQEIQLYQMREKQARKLSEQETDRMWHEVAMREADALAARMEQGAMDRYRRDLECKQHSDYQLEVKRQQRERDRELLKQETLRLKAKWEDDLKQEQKEERQREEKRKQTGEDRRQMVEQRHRTVAQQAADAKLIDETWDSLAGQGLAQDRAHAELMRQKEKELDKCNRHLIALKSEMARLEAADDHLFEAEAKQRQEQVDKRRCQYLMWSQKTNADVRKAMVDQIEDRKQAREQLNRKLEDENEYQRQLSEQLRQLVSHKQLEDARQRKNVQQSLLDQIAYNKLLKERALQEEVDQVKKFKIATEEYQHEITNMLRRPFFSEAVHPFMKQMSNGMQMREKCPCSKPDHCK